MLGSWFWVFVSGGLGIVRCSGAGGSGCEFWFGLLF